MKMDATPASGLKPRVRRSGATLVEALAGLVILGTLLVAVLVANSRLHRQRGRTAQRLEAVRVADRLLDGWWQKRDEFPRRDEGAVAADRSGRSWSWRTSVVENEDADALGCEVVALEVFAVTETGRTPSDAACRVEVLLPQKVEEE
jgi:type II secretory pathway pseudopilin PulG